MPIKYLLGNIEQYLSPSIVSIDKCGNRDFRQSLGKYLRSNYEGIEIKMPRSESDILVQLADMIVGAEHKRMKGRDYFLTEAIKK